MKKRILVVLLVLSLVLVGCGKKDYSDINVYKDLMVDKVNSIDKDFFKKNKESLEELGIAEQVKEYKDVTLELYDQILDFIPSETETIYNEFTGDLSEFFPEDLDDIQGDFDDLYSYLSDPEELSFFKEELDEEITDIKTVTEKIKKIPADKVKELQKQIQEEAEEYDIDPSDVVADAIIENM